MGIQLRVNTPQGGTSKVIDLCDSEAQLRKITVMQLKEKISEQLLISTFTVSLSVLLIQMQANLFEFKCKCKIFASSL